MKINSLVDIAIKYWGVAEVTGILSNELILKWIKKRIPWAKDDSAIAWCSIFMMEIVEQAGFKLPVSVNPMAKSWHNWGIPVDFNPDDLSNLQVGDLVISWRQSPHSGKGHVNLWINEQANGKYYGLGGNQNNCVNISPYPIGQIEAVKRPDWSQIPSFPIS